jgi:hypothetical protein
LKRSFLLLLVVAGFASGCVPYPVYKTLQPAAKVTVQDDRGKPVPGAAVTLVASAHPYGREKSRETKETTADGVAAFQPRREWKTEVLAMHGWEEYFWNWCVQKEGYETFSTINRGAPEFQIEPIVVLKAGQSRPCPQGIR